MRPVKTNELQDIRVTVYVTIDRSSTTEELRATLLEILSVENLDGPLSGIKQGAKSYFNNAVLITNIEQEK